ncbi:MAG: Cna B-type domain-containing protein, partial [Lachnospiraceae bacterium]|nr:Cna B-type domain-containing protein [Lachnospiraceae bacterium]
TATVAKNATATAALVNVYEQDLGSLKITKSISGLPEGEVPANLKFTVTGPDGYSEEIDYADFEDGEYTIEDLPVGEYTVTESGTEYDNYTLVEADSTQEASATVAKNETATAALVNVYEQDMGILKLTKEVKGLKETETVPDSTKFVISGTPTSGEDFDDIEVTYADIKNGDWSLKVPVGEYKVTSESGAEVDGYLLQTTLPDAVTVEKNGEATLTVINVYVSPATDDPPVLKTITKDKPENEDDTFTFVFTPIRNTAGLDVEEMPMPVNNGTVTDKITISVREAGIEKEFGTVTFYYAGTYVYTITEDPSDALPGYKYDDSVYTVTYEITRSEDGTKMEKVRTVSKDGEVVEISAFEFDNEYTAPPIDIPVKKVWNEASEVNPKLTRPKSITVVLKADIIECDQTLVLSAENDWSGKFENLPSQENGEKITYTIEEVEVKYYTTTISGDMNEGFVITNTCTYVPTGDDSNVLLWSASMMASMAGLGLVLKKKREEEAE